MDTAGRSSLLKQVFLLFFFARCLICVRFQNSAPPMPIIVLFRWLIFRIMLGSGLIKIRGDEIWRNGTALYYHFETQPIPGPLSRWFHFLPAYRFENRSLVQFACRTCSTIVCILATSCTSYCRSGDRVISD